MLVAGVVLVGCGGPGRPTPAVSDEVPPVSDPARPPPDAAAPDASADPTVAGTDAAAAAVPQVPAAAQVTVSFSVQPPFSETPPILRVTVHNPNAVAVPFTRFDAPACFARHYLAIHLARPDGKPVVAAPCAVKDWPGVAGQLAPYAVTTIELPFAKLFTKLSTGVYELGVDWDSSELERARPGAGVGAASTSLDTQRFVIAKIRASFRVAIGKRVGLPGGLRLEFRAHGHKHVMAGGPSSPLIIHGTLAANKQPPEEFTVHVFTDESRLFSIDDHVFELVAHEYDSWMQLRYFGQFALE